MRKVNEDDLYSINTYRATNFYTTFILHFEVRNVGSGIYKAQLKVQ